MKKKDDDEKEEFLFPLARVGQLKTIGQVASELGRLYRATRRGQVSSIEGFRMAGILNVLRTCLESGQIELRLEELERQAAAKGMPVLIEGRRIQ